MHARFARLLIGTLLFGLIASVPLPLGAQEGERAAEPAAEAEETEVRQESVVGVRQAEIPSRADEVAATQRRLETRLRDSTFLDRTVAATDEDAQALGDLLARLDRVDAVPVSAARIDDLGGALNRAQESIATRMLDIQERWAALRAELNDLQAMRQIWETTHERAVREEFPPGLTQRVTATLATIDQMIGTLEEVNDRAAALADRVSRQNATTLRAAERLDAISARLARGLLSREDSRLFQLISAPAWPPMIAELTDAAEYWWSTLVEFWTLNHASVYLLATIFVALLVVGLVARRRSAGWRDDPALEAAHRVVDLPLAMAVAFTVVAFRAVVPDPVRSTQDAAVLVALGALLPLGHAMLHPGLHRVLYVFSAIFVANLPWQLLPASSVSGQWLLALGIVLSFVGVAYVLADWEAARAPLGPRWWRLARAGLFLALAGFAAALAVGALGWIRLTRFLTEAFGVSIFAAIAFRVIYKAAIAVLPLVVRAPLAPFREGSRRQEPLLRRAAALVIGVYFLYRFGFAVLESFRIADPAAEWFSALLSASYDWGGLHLSLGSTLAALTLLLVTPFAARVVRFVIREEIAPRLKLPAGVDYSLTTLAGYVVWVIGIVASASAAGVSGTQMTVLFGALGVGLGFGLQAIVNNFVSGLILMFERPLKVGDRVQTATQAGTVTKIGIRASNIRTFAGADVVVPNGELITKEVTNWTLSDDIRRVEVRVSTAYGSRPREVLEVLHRIATEHDRVLDDPAPAAVMKAFGDSALSFELRAWVESGDFVAVGSELHVLVEEALREAGISLVVPRREILVQNADAGADSGANASR